MTYRAHTRLTPGQALPDFQVSLVDGNHWRLSGSRADRFTLIDVYRGRHCPRCHRHLLEMRQVLPRLQERGVEAVALSMDDADAAIDAVSTWNLGELKVGYGLQESDARSLGLFISQRTGDHEPRRFCEPALLLVRPDQTLYAALYATMPFMRFHYADLLEGLDAVIARDYPPRGGD